MTQEKTSINDLLFPKTTVISIAKNNETETRKIIMTKDTQTALQRASTLFLSYLMNAARENAHSNNKKSVNVDDVFDSVEKLGFGEGFLDQLRVLFQDYQDAAAKKKEIREKLKSLTSVSGAGESVANDEKANDESDSEDKEDAPANTDETNNGTGIETTQNADEGETKKPRLG
ncbi:hypothetical protein ACO0QE_002771 [Hanseniaspora vineae]